MDNRSYSVKRIIHNILLITAILPATLLVLLCMIATFAILSEINQLDFQGLPLLISMVLSFPGYAGLISIALGKGKTKPIRTAVLLGCGLLSILIVFFYFDLFSSPLHFVDLEFMSVLLWPFAVGLYFLLTIIIRQQSKMEVDEAVIDQE